MARGGSTTALRHAGVLIAVLGACVSARAQPPGFAGPAGPPPSARESAQVDLTGYWVALVTEDWLWRMITAPRGDATSVPLNQRGREVAGQWDPAGDTADEACRPFGAPALMRMPLRLHITWADDDTLRIETDAGQQTRLLHFGDAAGGSGPRSWQGETTAAWTRPVGGFDLKAAIGGRLGPPPSSPPKGSLKAVTTNLRAGYLRRNGLPYSEQTTLTEYFSRVSGYGEDYLTVLSIVHDPAYLNEDFVTSSHFKREPDDRGWHPSPCRTPPPLASAEAPQ